MLRPADSSLPVIAIAAPAAGETDRRQKDLRKADTIFPKNLRAYLFNDNLSNEPNFGQIPLGGQYL